MCRNHGKTCFSFHCYFCAFLVFRTTNFINGALKLTIDSVHETWEPCITHDRKVFCLNDPNYHKNQSGLVVQNSNSLLVLELSFLVIELTVCPPVYFSSVYCSSECLELHFLIDSNESCAEIMERPNSVFTVIFVLSLFFEAPI